MRNAPRSVLRGLLGAGLLAVALMTPAAASPANDAGNVTICHVTNSPTNPWIEITIGTAAFDGSGANDHSHHVAKDGRRDFEPVDGNCDADATDAGSSILD